jgi:hypothetical protein
MQATVYILLKVFKYFNMKNSIIIFIFFIITIFSSCKKENADNTFKLDDPVLSDSGVVLNWNLPTIENFNYYQVLRSLDGIYFNPIVISDSGSAFLNNYYNTSALDLGYFNGYANYYQLLSQGTHTIYSNIVKIQIPSPIVLHFTTLDAFAIPNSKYILIINWGGQNSYTIYLYDYENNNILKSLNLKTYSGSKGYYYGNSGEGYEFYFNDGSRSLLYVYDVNTLDLKDSIIYYGSGQHFAADSKKYLVYWDINRLYSIDRKSKSTNSIIADNYGYSNVFYLPSSDRFVCEADNATGYNYYKIDNNNNISFDSFFSYDREGNTYTYLPETNKLYAYNSMGGVYNFVLDLEEQSIGHFLDFDNNQIPVFGCWSGENQIMVASPTNKIYIYSASTLEILKVITVKYYPNVIVASDKYLICLTSTLNGLTLVDKIKIK